MCWYGTSYFSRIGYLHLIKYFPYIFWFRYEGNYATFNPDNISEIMDIVISSFMNFSKSIAMSRERTQTKTWASILFSVVYRSNLKEWFDSLEWFSNLFHIYVKTDNTTNTIWNLCLIITVFTSLYLEREVLKGIKWNWMKHAQQCWTTRRERNEPANNPELWLYGTLFSHSLQPLIANAV